MPMLKLKDNLVESFQKVEAFQKETNVIFSIKDLNDKIKKFKYPKFEKFKMFIAFPESNSNNTIQI